MVDLRLRGRWHVGQDTLDSAYKKTGKCLDVAEKTVDCDVEY